ncbi:MAG: DNA polymerase III subunit delta [Flavobacteriales bacterium]|nr:DNA polymerase III subunit delta [Flavobacteriales bacterium]
MQFKDIPSNVRVKSQLLHAVENNRLSHAHLFTGEDGSSSLAMALAFAQYLMCENKTASDSCGVCPACLKSEKLIHPDLHCVFPVITGKGTNPVSDHFIEEWRGAIASNPFMSEEEWYLNLGDTNKQGFISVYEANELSKKTVLKPYENSYRVIIVWHAEKMHNPAANKLLKLLEEPPEKTIFILLTSSSENLLETIVSRLQNTTIEPCDENNLTKYLMEIEGVEEKTASEISHLSSGNIGQALKLIKGSELLEQNTEEFQNWMRMCYKARIIELTSWVDMINRWGREQQKGFLHYALHMVRESLVRNFADSSIQKVREEEEQFTKNFAPFIHQNNAIEIIEEIELAHKHISRNGSSKFIFMDLTLKMVVLLHVKNLTLQETN